MKVVPVLTVALIFLSVLAPSRVSAHTGGASFETTVGDQVVDIGYEPAQPKAGDRVVFDFNLFDIKEMPVPYESVWVRLVQDEKTVLATGVVHATVGATSLVWSPPYESSVTVHARFEKKGDVLAEVSFDLPLQNSPSRKNMLVLGFIASLFLLAALGYRVYYHA